MNLERNLHSEVFPNSQKVEEFRSSSTPQKGNNSKERFDKIESLLFQFSNFHIKRSSPENSEYDLSIREESLFNKDILKEINSPAHSKVILYSSRKKEELIHHIHRSQMEIRRKIILLKKKKAG
jgi:hypothetical protein